MFALLAAMANLTLDARVIEGPAAAFLSRLSAAARLKTDFRAGTPSSFKLAHACRGLNRLLSNQTPATRLSP